MNRAADRDQVWKATVKHNGDRAKAAAELDISLRTYNRYIADYNLYPDMDRAGFIKRPGPPRGQEAGSSRRQAAILRAIKKYSGELDYGELATDLYGIDDDKMRQRVYSALNDLKINGVIANDGVRWFILEE